MDVHKKSIGSYPHYAEVSIKRDHIKLCGPFIGETFL